MSSSQFTDTKSAPLYDLEATLLRATEAAAKHPGPGRRSWLPLFYSLMIVTVTALVFVMVMQQQLQVNAMEEKIAELQDMLEANEPVSAVITTDQNDTVMAPQVRRRRQTRGSNQQETAFAHLVGNLGRIPRSTSEPYTWVNPTSSRHTTNRGSIHNLNVATTRGSTSVRAVRVLISGWYYVYAQIPYLGTNTLVGHKIVATPNCGISMSRTILGTSTTLPNRHGASIPRTSHYLGGVVYLDTRTQVEVRPLETPASVNEDGDQYAEVFFGLYLIKANSHSPMLSCS